jgi:hypothetical protein
MTGQDDFSELISAFLDGEVTPEQQARVEERLVDNAEDRRLFEDMRAMRNGLQSLPRHELDRDLSEIVLRRAERAMLANEAPIPGEESAEPPPVAEDRERSAAAIVAHMPSPSEPSSRRPLIWFGLTVAAAVLVMTMARPWFDESREVADETTDEIGFAAPAGSESSRSRSPNDVAADGTVNGISPTAANKTANADSTDAEELKTNHFFQKEPQPGGEDVAGRRRLDEFSGQTVEGQDAADGTRWDIERDHERRETAAAPAQPPANRPDASRLATTTMASRGNQVALGEIDQVEIPSDRVLLVRLDLSPEAVRTRSFDRSLSRHKIHYGPAKQQWLKVREALATKDGEAGELTDGVALNDFEGQEAGQDLLARVDYSDMQLVIVDATEEKVQALLHDLEQHPESFPIVDVDPGPESAELKGVARKLTAAPKTAPAARYSQQDGAAPAVDSLADSRAAGIEELEEEAMPQAEATLPPLTPAESPLARKPLMDDSAPTAESAAESELDAADEPMPPPAAELPALPKVRGTLGREETQPAPTAAPARQPVGSKAGPPGPDSGDAANSAPEALSEETAGEVDNDAPMDPAGSLREAREGGESIGGRSDPKEFETRDVEKQTSAGAQSRGGFGAGAVAGKAPGSAEDKKKSRIANAPTETDEEGEPSADGPESQTESKLDSRGVADAEEDDAFGVVPMPELRQRRHEEATRRATSGDAHRGFAQRLEMPYRKSQTEVAKKRAEVDRAKTEKELADAADLDDHGGEGGGGSAPRAPLVTPRPAGDSGAGHAYSFKDRYEVPSDSPVPERLVRVLFVIRAVEPVVDLAADVPAEEPPVSEARSLAGPPAAAMEASEAEIEPASPAEP